MTSSRALLDTNALLWLLDGDVRLGGQARGQIETAEVLAVSVGSLWEIAIKLSLGKLAVPAGFYARLRSLGFDRLDIRDDHLVALESLPLHHRDPFDRLLICQAAVDGLTVITADEVFMQYDVPVVDARL